MPKTKKKTTFYVVDDNPLVIEMMSKLLKAAGYSVKTSNVSIDAINDIAKVKPDCVISDLMMPGVDGLQLCKEVRGHKDLKNTKFIKI